MDENQVDAVIDNAMPAAESEKTLTQSQVSAIVQREKAKAAEAARRQAEEQYQQKIANLNSSQANGLSSSERNALYQEFRENLNSDLQKAQAQQENEYYQGVLNNAKTTFEAKMKQGAAGYDDFDAVMKDFDPNEFQQLMFLTAGLDNAADVMYELNNSPQKLATVDYLARTSPKKAQAELAKISASISQNRQALMDAQGNRVQPPLDQLQPSRVSGSNSNMSIQDLRNLPYLRG